MNVTNNLSKHILSNKGSGIGVILYGMTLLLILIFTAVNIVNSKTIESGYNSLRDAVQSASAGSVIHLLTSNRSTTTAQNSIITSANYDIYLQLALGYLINRNPVSETSDRYVQNGEINNFIKLDHQKVVNTTMALFADAVFRNRGDDHYETISNTDKYKILMFFIEPYADASNQKYFDIICYSNDNWSGDVTEEYARSAVKIDTGNMENVYVNVEKEISNIVNGEYSSRTEYKETEKTSFLKIGYGGSKKYDINLNANGGDLAGKVREMETYPHYLIVVKDFALPTIFLSKDEKGEYRDTNDRDAAGVRSLFRTVFTSLSGDGKLHTPMFALNTGKVQRQSEDKNWTKERWHTDPTSRMVY